MANNILVVDDEEHILELLRFNLANEGYNVLTATSGEQAVEICAKHTPDLVLLDVMLPNLDGFETCKKLKTLHKTQLLPIIMITAKNEEEEKIKGLEIGADDYITKPFSVKELIARVKAMLRRTSTNVSSSSDTSRIIAGDLKIDISTYEVLQGNKKVDLTLKEFEMLKTLIKGKGKVLTRDFLLESVWGYEYFGESRTVDVHIRHIRQKLGDVDGTKYIETVRGLGYKFNISE